VKIYAELERTCYICKETKKVTEYYKDKSQTKGLSFSCKECDKKKGLQKRANMSKTEKVARDFKDNLKKKYGMTIDNYQKLYNAQQGCCAICGKHRSEQVRNLAVDHCHISNEIRSLLCGNCNPGLGYFLDSKELLLKAVAYLEKFKK
jgi:hypothetical protein